MPTPALSSLCAQVSYKEDIAAALEMVEKECGALLKTKGISFKKIEKEFTKAAKKVKTDQDQFVLLVKLVARLEDGHGQVRLTDLTQGLSWPEDDSRYDPSKEYGDSGLAICRIDKSYYVKAVAGPSRDAGLLPGSEILKIDGEKPSDWLEAKIAEGREIISWSTEHQAFFWATHWGLSAPQGDRIKLEVKQPDGKKKKRTVSITKARVRMAGPAFWPEGLTGEKDVSRCILPSGYGYLYIRRCKSDLPAQVDQALAALGPVPGLILDFRGNSGGSFDHDALLGRFVPEGEKLSFAKTIPPAGPAQYGGPIVVLIDGTVVSAGETASGMFKEEGRGLMIGESPTAGMSASKKTLDLPSGKFQLYVSVYSNKSRWQDGKGIEGLGVQPHETVQFDPEDLIAGVDSLILAAEARLRDGSWKDVPYDPAKFGWKAP
ncbi:MAG: S41 family peptidase [Planctomycetota bacterium]